ncbi:hypothetical protein [Agaribacterium sp. ZY112]|uniref:hypothetical protein n=1 Tax=Agaribacterium sp. ZY112 TaxID=3233574 RepID=UPI00352584BB
MGMGILYGSNWNTEKGLKAKHGKKYKDKYNTLSSVGWQQMNTMLNTWANRELRTNHAKILRELAVAIRSSDYNVTVQLSFHQLERYDGVDYFHVTVLSPFGPTVHLFSKVKSWFGGKPDIKKSFWGGSTSPFLVEERYRYKYSKT